MPNFEKHDPGTFCWIELATTDGPGAKAFYSTLFGWTVNENDMGEMGTYYIFQKNGRDCAAMYQMGAQQQGMPPNWLSYIAVADADASTEKAESLGGNVVMGPFDVMDFGRMSVIMDPQGAAFAIWEAKANIGLQIRDEANTLGWNELQARDLAAAKTFYTGLVNWNLKESPEYTEFHVGDRGVGGMLLSKAPEGVPSFWLPYFVVEDCDGMVTKAQDGGGGVHVPPMDIPNVGRFAVVTDPQGVSFAVIKLELQPR